MILLGLVFFCVQTLSIFKLNEIKKKKDHIDLFVFLWLMGFSEVILTNFAAFIIK